MNARPIFLVLALTVGCALAQEPASTPPAAATANPAASSPAAAEPAATPANPPVKSKRTLLKYTAPKETAEGKRLDGDGGSRSEKKFKLPKWLYTLTPVTGKGLTTQAQPSLFTFQSEGVPLEYRVTISEPGNAKPLFIYAASSSAAGIHRVDLAEFNVTLKPGVDYEWNVALRADAKNRSTDLIAKGAIRRIEPEAALAQKLKSAPQAEHASIYAEAGIWYDALASISDQIAANRDDKELLELRNGLLEQVALKEAVAAH
jgi:hypothetical protein